MRPFQNAVNTWLTVPGIKHRLAWTLVAEVGPTVEAFPSAGDMVSWAGVCPGNNKTAGKRKSGTTRAGNPWLRRALCEAAWAASKSKGTYLQAQFRRLAALRGPKRALIAVAKFYPYRWLLHAATGYHLPRARPGLLRQTQHRSSHPSLGQTPRSTRAHSHPRATLHCCSKQLEEFSREAISLIDLGTGVLSPQGVMWELISQRPATHPIEINNPLGSGTCITMRAEGSFGKNPAKRRFSSAKSGMSGTRIVVLEEATQND